MKGVFLLSGPEGVWRFLLLLLFTLGATGVTRYGLDGIWCIYGVRQGGFEVIGGILYSIRMG